MPRASGSWNCATTQTLNVTATRIRRSRIKYTDACLSFGLKPWSRWRSAEPGIILGLHPDGVVGQASYPGAAKLDFARRRRLIVEFRCRRRRTCLWQTSPQSRTMACPHLRFTSLFRRSLK